MKTTLTKEELISLLEEFKDDQKIIFTYNSVPKKVDIETYGGEFSPKIVEFSLK